jgi:uncharacterized membrane protein
MRILRLFIFLACLLFSSSVYADVKHQGGNQAQLKMEAAQNKDAGMTEGKKAAELKESAAGFPTFHPLAVHFPIVVIIAALPIFSLGVFRQQVALRQTGVVLVTVGLLGALLASYIFHPHTMGLTPEAKSVLSNHDFYACITIYSAALAVVIGTFQCLTRHRSVFLQAVTTVLLLLSVVTVSLAGHYGATLVHIRGVGPEGRFLETEHVGLHFPFLNGEFC